MKCFRKSSKIEVVPFHGMEFLSDQDGVIERELKAKVCEILQNSSVSEAYLARVQYPNDVHERVTLCLNGGTAEMNYIVQRVRDKFAPMFSKDVTLDILFLNKEQTQNIQLVCTPFFRRPLVQ